MSAVAKERVLMGLFPIKIGSFMLKPCNTPTLDDMVLGLVKVSEILKAKEEGKLENLSMYGK